LLRAGYVQCALAVASTTRRTARSLSARRRKLCRKISWPSIPRPAAVSTTAAPIVRWTTALTVSDNPKNRRGACSVPSGHVRLPFRKSSPAGSRDRWAQEVDDIICGRRADNDRAVAGVVLATARGTLNVTGAEAMPMATPPVNNCRGQTHGNVNSSLPVCFQSHCSGLQFEVRRNNVYVLVLVADDGVILDISASSHSWPFRDTVSWVPVSVSCRHCGRD